jgi:hypothetical protein
MEAATKAVFHRWFLASSKRASVLKELNEIERHQVLLDYFYQTGTVTEPVRIGSLTELEQTEEPYGEYSYGRDRRNDPLAKAFVDPDKQRRRRKSTASRAPSGV